MLARSEAQLPLAAEVVWRLAKKTATQLYLSRETFGYDAELPPVREEGYEGEYRIRLAGLIPAWRHWQRFERVDDQRRQILVCERGAPYRVWNHGMLVESQADGTCRFVDTIEVEGRLWLLTPVVWLAARTLCRARMRRLEELCQVLVAIELGGAPTGQTGEA